jgi:hypothetical protein
MATRSDVEGLRKRRQERRLDDIARGASRKEKRTPAEKLDAADALIRDAWSLHDAAKETLVRRRR